MFSNFSPKTVPFMG